MKSKKITKSGAITIPVDMRRAMNLQNGDVVDIELQDGKLVILPHINRCFICGNDYETVLYKGKYFCRDCVKLLGGMGRE